MTHEDLNDGLDSRQKRHQEKGVVKLTGHRERYPAGRMDTKRLEKNWVGRDKKEEEEQSISALIRRYKKKHFRKEQKKNPTDRLKGRKLGFQYVFL